MRRFFIASGAIFEYAKGSRDIVPRFFDLVKTLGVFLWKKKVWWMLPIVILLLLTGALIVFGQAGVLSSFVYALF